MCKCEASECDCEKDNTEDTVYQIPNNNYNDSDLNEDFLYEDPDASNYDSNQIVEFEDAEITDPIQFDNTF